jgi:hypothetical protein
MVKEGSIKRQADGVTIAFVVTDTEKDITVNYKGILPDLFMEGKGVVAQGKLAPMAALPPAKCWPSMTKTTCRRKPPRQSATRTSGRRPTARQRRSHLQQDPPAVTRMTSS